VSDFIVVIGDRNLYRYTYNQSTQKNDYRGPVGNEPELTEVEFMAAMTKDIKTIDLKNLSPTVVRENPGLVSNVPLPEGYFLKAEVTENVVKFRLKDPEAYKNYYTLDGDELLKLGFRVGKGFRQQSKRVRSAIYKYGLSMGGNEWVTRDLAKYPDSFYVVGTPIVGKTRDRHVQSIGRRI